MVVVVVVERIEFFWAQQPEIHHHHPLIQCDSLKFSLKIEKKNLLKEKKNFADNSLQCSHCYFWLQYIFFFVSYSVHIVVRMFIYSCCICLCVCVWVHIDFVIFFHSYSLFVARFYDENTEFDSILKILKKNKNKNR